MNKIIIYLFTLAVFLSQVYSQNAWEKDPNNPVLRKGQDGAWDDVQVGAPTVIYDGTLYHMWFNGNSGNGTNIGYASSDDKINWEKHPVPVLEKGSDGSWDNLFILHPTVYFDGATYHMWYMGSNGSAAQIGYATSPDSISWSKHPSNPVLSPGEPGSWDDTNVNSPEVLFIDGIFHMWYGGSDGSNEQTGHATSVDGITWVKDELNPVLKVGEEGWDVATSAQPSVLYDGTYYRIWYAGGPGFGWSIGYASSEDGRIWNKDVMNNPALNPGLSGSWDSVYVAYHTVCFNSDSTGLDMWYAGAASAGFAGDIGLASLDTIPQPVITSIQSENQNNIPNDFTLYQNYPNPFNPSTLIKYQIPKVSFVTLKVYDILGNEILTLVNEEKAIGVYELNFHHTALSSGVYFYKLQAGDFLDTKKMVLLK